MALTIKQISAALQAQAGNVTEAARALGISRQGLSKRIATSTELQQLARDARESMVDLAESEARKQIESGNTAMIIFTLKTLGKSRGYVERSEITGADGGPIVVKGYTSVTPDEWDKDSSDRNL